MTLHDRRAPISVVEPGQLNGTPNEGLGGRRQLNEEVASHLRQAIIAGEYAPGESLRAEALGESLNVSATPVREALQVLRTEGFVKLLPRRGFMVAPLTGGDIQDIFEAHALIAGELAARAARRITSEQAAELRAIHVSLIGAATRGETAALEEDNHKFHRAVYRLADSERLHWALGTFAKYVPRAFYAEIEGWPETTLVDHSDVLDAILVRDAGWARRSMSQHIRNSGERLATHFDARLAADSERR